jgi:tetratricopeptide (TPR) repeat protein
MKYFLFYSIVLMLLTACSDDKHQATISESANQQQTQQITKQSEETPSSISGSDSHVGPNPHAKLSSEQHISVALKHADEGRMDEALDVLARAIIDSPNDASLIGALGGLLLSQNRVSEAIEYLEEAVALAPDSAVLLVNRSQAYRKFNRPQEAMADLDKAIAINPQMVPARFNRGVLLYDDAKYKEALADFDVCIETSPETAGPYFNRAVTRDAMGDLAGAVRDMSTFIELSDNEQWNKIARDTMAGWKKQSK